MQVSLRQKDILDKIVREYIGSARPISSQLLEKKYCFKVCPATIRIEMQRLTDRGYLFQPHTSAGRVPTDKGYRSFVDDLLEKELSDVSDIMGIKKMLAQEKDFLKIVSRLTKFLAESSSNLAVSFVFQRNFVFKEGWGRILKEPEFEDKDLVSGFVELLENLEKEIENLDINSRVRAYIGGEHPFGGARNFTTLVSQCHFSQRKKGILAILGPKRMDYNKNIGLLNLCKELLG